MIARRALALAVALLVGACGARTAVETGEPESAAARDAGLDAPRPRDASADTPDVPERADAPRDGGRDAPDTSVPDAGDPCEVDPGPLRGTLCERALTGPTVAPSCPGGFVDVVAVGPGTLRWECDGTRAEAVFAGRAYRGSRTGDRFALCIATEFDYADGCRWRSSQRLDGTLEAGELALVYREMAILGMACFPPCSAEGTVSIDP